MFTHKGKLIDTLKFIQLSLFSSEVLMLSLYCRNQYTLFRFYLLCWESFYIDQ